MSENTTLERIQTYYEKNQKWLFPILLILGILIVSIPFSIQLNRSYLGSLFLISVGVLVIFGSIRFYQFYTGPARMEQTFNQFYASHFISSFYKIYFPVIIVAVVVQVIFQLSLLPAPFGLGLLDYESISPSFMITFTIFSFITAIGIVALSDYEMKNKSLMYSEQVGKISFLKSFGYIIPLSGLYIGVIFFIRFYIEQTYGLSTLIPIETTSFEIDASVTRSAKFWGLSTENEKTFILVTFFASYIALEFFLRGLMGRQAEGYGLGPAGMVFTPAILQATAFTSGITVFSQPIYYFFELFDAFLLGIILGLVLWRTGNFASVIFTALFIRLMDNRLEFQRVILSSLPRPFGEYDPFDDVITLADQIGNYLVYFQIALVAISPFIIIVSYQEVAKILRGLYDGLKNQWFGLLALGIAFFLIDLIFSYATDLLGALFGFILAIVAIRFILSYFLKVLPPPTEMPVLNSKKDMFDGAIPLSVSNDIKYIESDRFWFSKPKRNGIIGGFGFIYFLFLAAAYRQYQQFSIIESITFTVFLVILPAFIIGMGLFLISRAQDKGYFFSEKWRSTLMNFSLIVFLVNILIWTDRSSIVNFSWRLVPFSLFFVLLIWPKPMNNPTRDLALGLARDSRYATFRWVRDNSEEFISSFNELLELPSDNIQLGSYILAAELGILEPDDLIVSIRKVEDITKGEKLGMIFALGILKEKSAEGLLVDLIREEDMDVKMAGYWALGQVGTPRALSRMAKILEENPKKDLIPIAENAILTIDPNYPLAGIRDSISIN